MWSKKHSDAVSRANEAINMSRSELNNDIIESCITACRECWNDLKELAKKRFSDPLSRVPVLNDAKRIVDTLLDTTSGNDNRVNQLFDSSESPEIPGAKEHHAKSFIGALVLKNGVKESNPPSKEYLKESANLVS
ncbi:hypothetical protein DM867_05640 [Halosegnis rubeus]|uniref:Uncharacterized protein n=1 Tax=Halosegnis rubeus TaxID=2212850 RepID=A0A5N5UAA9_9EURY|nr:hypothetical protein [Halosegnis rubeus]KAB7514602.1 hypothetical protein DM867_05640 [Halosegnis rubeus]